MNHRWFRQFRHQLTMMLLTISLFVVVPPSRAQHTGDAVLLLSNRDGHWGLYTLALATGEASPFSAGYFLSTYKIRYANLSADGSRLAFVATDYTVDGAFFDNVFWLDVSTRRITRVTESRQNDNGFPAWSPDSSTLAYLSGGINGGFAELRIYDPASGQDQRVTNSFMGQRTDGSYTAFGAMNVFDWSPDGQQFVIDVQPPFTDDPNAATNILVLMNVDGTNVRTIADKDISLGTGRWNSESDALYAACNFGIEYDSICRIDPLTREVNPLLEVNNSVLDGNRPHYVANMLVLPDEQIVFNLVSGNDLYLFNMHTGQVTSLSTGSQSEAIDILLGWL